jgi:hypothetical protein
MAGCSASFGKKINARSPAANTEPSFSQSIRIAALPSSTVLTAAACSLFVIVNKPENGENALKIVRV